MLTQTFKLLTNGNATGAAATWGGGEGIFEVEATFTGATISLQRQLPNGTWADVGSNTTLTANGGGRFWVKPGAQLRAAVTGGPPSGVYAEIYSTPTAAGLV